LIRHFGHILLLLLFTSAAFTGEDSLAGQRVLIGWQDTFLADQGWKAEPWKISLPDPDATAEFGPKGATFRAPTPGAGMVWTRTFNPVWITSFPYLEIEYEIENAELGANQRLIILSDDSTGPITPGATNPENPLASGAVAGLGKSETGKYHFVRDVRDFFDSDRIARITFLLNSGKKPATLRVSNLTFWATDPGHEALADFPRHSAQLLEVDSDDTVAALKENTDWKPVQLPSDSAIGAKWVEHAFEAAWPVENSIPVSKIPFELANPDRAACVTAVSDAGTITVPVGARRGNELALLLGIRAFGYPRPAFGKVPDVPREPITSPHEVVVVTEYDNGGRRFHMPWAVAGQDYQIERLPQAYIIPLDPDKNLIRFHIQDQMNYGQVFLLGASINTGEQRKFPQLISEHPPNRFPQIEKPDGSPARIISQEGAHLLLESSWLHLDLDLLNGFRVNRLILAPYNQSIITSTVDLLKVLDSDSQQMNLHLLDHTVSPTESGIQLNCSWQTNPDQNGPTVSMQAQFNNNGQIHLSPTLHNPLSKPLKIQLIYPNLQECRISPSIDDTWYLLGTRSTVLSNHPVHSNERYSGGHPLQFMDLFDAIRGGGIAVQVQDTQLFEKHFQFEKNEFSCSMSVHYPHLIVAGEDDRTLPTAVILAHLEHWREPFEVYRRWVRDTLLSGRHNSRMKDIFFCRRDYPLGGTDYLFDVRSMQYQPRQLVEETRNSINKIDMIDISGWAYHETTGRVGNYLENDLGGLEELAEAVHRAHSENVPIGLYFEGYLLDRRAPLAERALPDWQLVNEQGQPMWWSGEKEFYVCPGVGSWQEALSNMVAEVAQQTQADAVYIDQFGFSNASLACWAPHHGHPVPSHPPFEERKMLELVRTKLDNLPFDVALYCEQMPCDALVRYIDGAFNHGMVDADESQNPTKFQMLRFIFPEVSMIEMISSGIRPIPVAVDDLHRCFFHGLAVWLKGRMDSWYSPQFRDYAARIAPIFNEHADVLRSASCTPLIGTMRENVFANSFSGRDKEIITVYNARYSDVTGDLLQVDLPVGWAVIDLLEQSPVDFYRNGESSIIQGNLAPRSATAFLLKPPSTIETSDQ
jgi:hypothetical protein